MLFKKLTGSEPLAPGKCLIYRVNSLSLKAAHDRKIEGVGRQIQNGWMVEKRRKSKREIMIQSM